MGEVHVRRAAAGDAAGIARCQGRCWLEAYGHLVHPGFFDTGIEGIGTDRWEQVIDADGADVAVATTDDEVIGFASAGPALLGPAEPDGSSPPRERQLFAVYLSARFHGTGVAGQLLALSVGPGPAHVWVLEDNPRARAFYSRHGFAPDGARAVDSWTGLPEVRLVR